VLLALLNHWNNVVVVMMVEAKIDDDGACHLFALLPFTSR